MLSLITAPLHAISISMQLSVIPHLTIYGDVKESQVNKPGVVKQGLQGIGLIENKVSTTEITNEVKHDLMKMPENRGDLMKASG
jgi:hypothetical protein